ncbi:unnamed protein product [Cuscuta campestris]|uniref:Uncharacterized protein n=1 Tax=Cuscuta campestris TaxID=132261 RepID=A0A484KVT4_9ASTE|nr:unnamed protein product [Cuscuta campestris]
MTPLTAESPATLESRRSPSVDIGVVGGGESMEGETTAERELNFITLDDLVGKKFVRDKITEIIRSNFHGPWKTYTEIPQQIRNRWWSLFMNQHCWEDKNETMKKAFHTRCSNWLNKTLAHHRKEKTRPEFVAEGDWKQMMEYWGTAKKISEKSEKSKKSRASEKAKERQYHGGSISISEHEERMEKKEKKKPSRIEVLKHCFTSQDGEPTTLVLEIETRYNTIKSQQTQECVGDSSEMDDTDAYVEAAGGVVKKRVCGMGSKAWTISSGSSESHGGAAMSSIPMRWKNEIEKEVQARLEKQKEDILAEVRKAMAGSATIPGKDGATSPSMHPMFQNPTSGNHPAFFYSPTPMMLGFVPTNPMMMHMRGPSVSTPRRSTPNLANEENDVDLYLNESPGLH